MLLMMYAASWPFAKMASGQATGSVNPIVDDHIVNTMALLVIGALALWGVGTVCHCHDDHNGDGRTSLRCPAPPGVQEELVSAEPRRFFKPPVSSRGTFPGWLGVFLDMSDENEVGWTRSPPFSRRPTATSHLRA